MDQSFYQTSQFADMASVSVRTLRYYDQVGLLSPSHYSEAGYRLYTNADLLNLQQILALKFLGFSLEEIKVCLQTEPSGLHARLAQQRAMMQEKRTQLTAIIQAIEKTEQLLQVGQYSWQAIMRVIQVIQMEQKQSWQDKYFTPEQRQTMENLIKTSYSEDDLKKLTARTSGVWSEDDQKRVDQQYAFLYAEVKRLVASGADPTSPEGQAVAKIKYELLRSFTGDDPSIEIGLKKWWENFYALPEEQKAPYMSANPSSKEEDEFLEAALKIYRQGLQ